MVNYKDGKIYKIVDNTNGDIYIGSTCCKLLCQRLRQHKNDYKRCINKKRVNNITSYEIIKNNDYYIELIENFPCDSKDELHKRERHYIKTLKCVNNVIPLRSRKEYYEDNKKKLISDRKEYYKNNTYEIKRKMSDYYKDNKKKLSLKTKSYYEKNKEKNKDKKKDYDKKRRECIKNWGDLYYIKDDIFT